MGLNRQMNEYSNIVKAHFPGLLLKIQRRIEETEQGLGDTDTPGESFLWEHTKFVAAISHEICIREGIDPLLPVIGALIHDLGKFPQGKEEARSDTPEEMLSTERARVILESEKMNPQDIESISSGILALYDENLEKNAISNVVHDADFLAKSGRMGVAAFFSKAALRGKGLIRSLLEGASKEMTYAAVLPGNMRTQAGRILAEEKSRKVLNYFNELLMEMNNHGIFSFTLEETLCPCPEDPKKKVPLILVHPKECPQCGSSFKIEYETRTGMKCRKLIADIQCTNCSQRFEIAFCLPEISGCP